jgi:hypothetical protein
VKGINGHVDINVLHEEAELEHLLAEWGKQPSLDRITQLKTPLRVGFFLIKRKRDPRAALDVFTAE